MVKVLDLVDKKLLHLLSVNGRASFTGLGKKLGISESGIRKRIAKLKRNGTIKGFSVKIGKTGAIKSFVFASTSNTLAGKKILEKVKVFHEVIRLGELSGKKDLFFECVFLSQQELNSFVDTLAGIDGIESVESFIILEELNGIA